MYKKVIKTLTLCLLLFTGIMAWAVPADKRPVTIKQSNGKTLTFILKGDERMHWAETTDGYALVHNSNGEFVYATKDIQGNMVASPYLAANKEERSTKENEFLATQDKHMFYSQTQVKQFNKAWEAKAGTKASKKLVPPIGKDSMLVILVGSSDKPFSLPKADFDSLCYAQNYKGTGSVRDYFYTNSGGKFDLAIRVVGPYQLSSTMAAYANNTGNLVKHAVNAAYNDGVDFSHFDNDNDGYVDDIIIFYAGTPQSSSGNPNEIWPHCGSLEAYGGMTPKNNKKIDTYNVQSELNYPSKTITSIGTLCHEFGHALGLPDEYDTDYGPSGTTTGSSIATGTWSVMCEGCYNNNANSPCLWSAAQKLETGWITDFDTLSAAQDSILLPYISGASTDKAYRINLNKNKEFLVIEHRKKQGFDAYLPGEGLLIYHGQMDSINNWLSYGKNTINCEPEKRGWYLEAANGKVGKKSPDGDISTAATPFPGSSNTTFFAAGAPNEPKYVSGDTIDISITGIQYVNDSVMIFNFNSSLPDVQTNNISGSNTVSSFSTSGKVVYLGNATITAKGIVYSTLSSCNFNEDSAVFDTDNSDLTSISATITGLQPGTLYYYRAFVKTSEGKIALGNIKSTTTSTGLGYISTQSATNITMNSATLRGSLTFTGAGEFVAKGFVYNTSSATAPALDDENSTVISLTDATTGAFTHDITGLETGQTYYYRAYITNSYGTFYGAKTNFTTKYPAINNNTIASDQQICKGSTPAQLTGQQATGGLGSFTYRWEEQSGSSAWKTASGTYDQVNYQPQALTSTTYFRRVAISDGKVEENSNTVTIEVLESVGGSITSVSDSYTAGESFTLTLGKYKGSVVDWEQSSDNEQSWSSAGNAGMATFTQIINQEGAYSFRVKVQNGQCDPAYSSTKQITINSNALTDADNAEFVTIMPNPTNNGTFNVKSNMANAQSIVITNTLGQVVYSQSNADLTDKVISLDNAEEGTYVITILNGDKIVTKKLIVNK